MVDSKGEEDEDEENSSEESDFTLLSKTRSKTSTLNTKGNKRSIDESSLEERKMRKLLKEEESKRMIELQDQKTDKMIQMLTNYEQDQYVLIERMNLMSKQLNKLNGYNSDDIAKENEKRSLRLPSSKNEEVIKQIVQIAKEQESIETLPSTQTKPTKETSTLVVATSNLAEPPKETSNQTESPNSLNNTSTRTDATNALATTIEDESFEKNYFKKHCKQKKIN
jgi:hypothetical protein